MDWQVAFNIAFGGLCGVLGWVAKTLYDAVNSLKDDLSALREEIASDRVHKDDFRDAIRELKEMLSKIFDKLDGKADK